MPAKITKNSSRDRTTVFTYSYLGDAPLKELAESISIELNEGQAFSRYERFEEPVRTARLEPAQRDIKVGTTGLSTLVVEAEDGAFEGPSLVELFTVFWSNLQDYGMLRLDDFWPSRHLAVSLTARKGRPILGLGGIRKLLGLSPRVPLLGTILKPSRLLSLTARREQAGLLASTGFNLIKEDETHLPLNEAVVREATEIQHYISRFPSLYVPNVSACHLSDGFIHALLGSGVKVVMVNVFQCGWSWLAHLMELAPGLGIWIHRVGYENVASTLGMRALLRALRLAGADLVHIGTPWTHRPADLEEARTRSEILRNPDSGFPESTPVITKTTAETVPAIIRSVGVDVCLMACGALRQSGQLQPGKITEWVSAARRTGAAV